MMNWDWFSTLSEQQNTTIEKIIQLEDEVKNLKNDKKTKKEHEIEEERIKILSPNAHLSYHLFAVKNENENKASATNFRSTWQNKNLQIDMSKHITGDGLKDFFEKDFLYSSINLSIMPQYSFLIQFIFTLEKPFISRDEQDFYIIDNPVRKDKVFGLPYIAPSSWKGSLRASLWQLSYKAEDEEIRRIFGNEREVEEHERLRAGRLHLFPTFLTNKGLEIINPHDRETRVGKKPILFESVPEGTSGRFTLLYVPFNLIGKEEMEIRKQISRDILLIAEGLRAMFRDYGFGAKTSSGFGIAKSELTGGKLILKAEGIKVTQKEEIKIQEPAESFLKYLNEDGIVKDEFKSSREVGLLSNPEYIAKGQQLGGGSFTEFKKFRRWYVEFGEQWQKHIQSRSAPTPKWPTLSFESFDELLNVAEKIEKSLKSKEEMQ